MHPSQGPKLSMFFSHTLSEQGTDFLSLYFEQQHWSKFFELVEEYGSFQILKKDADEFLLIIGKHEFNVVRDFHRCIISIGQISSLTKGAAELLAKIADLLFHDRKNRFMVNTNNPTFEAVMWDVCFNLKIALKPASKEQAARFQTWLENKGLQYNASSGFSQLLSKSNDVPTPDENPGKTNGS